MVAPQSVDKGHFLGIFSVFLPFDAFPFSLIHSINLPLYHICSRNLKALFYATSKTPFLQIPPLFSKTFQKTIDKPPKKCGASRPYL